MLISAHIWPASSTSAVCIIGGLIGTEGHLSKSTEVTRDIFKWLLEVYAFKLLNVCYHQGYSIICLLLSDKSEPWAICGTVQYSTVQYLTFWAIIVLEAEWAGVCWMMLK